MQLSTRGAISFLMVAFLLTGAIASADATSANPSNCDQLFNLPANTVTMGGKDSTVMNSNVCAAYQYLITKYTPGPASQVGLSNPKVQGITNLNPAFAVELATMLKAMPNSVGIISAYRTPAAQAQANPSVKDSSHEYGCAVDLAYSQSNCGSQECQWVKGSAGQYGLQIRMQYSPEWNHIEPLNLAQCKAGSSAPATPGQGIASAINGLGQALGLPTQQVNTQGCYTSLNPIIYNPPGTTYQSQCISSAATPPPPPPPPPPAQSSAPAPAAQPAATTPSVQPTGSTPIGTAVPIATQTPIATPVPLTTQISGDGTTSPVSANDFIDQYAGFTAVDIATATPIDASALDQNLGGDAILEAGTSSDVVAQEDTGEILGTPAQQTFTSADLANSPAPSSSTLGNILSDMQNVLYSMLYYLQPFGGNLPGTVPAGTSVQYAD